MKASKPAFLAPFVSGKAVLSFPVFAVTVSNERMRGTIHCHRQNLSVARFAYVGDSESKYLEGKKEVCILRD